MAAPHQRNGRNGHTPVPVEVDDEPTASIRLDRAAGANVQFPAVWLRVIVGALVAGALALTVAAWRVAVAFSALAGKAEVRTAVETHAADMHPASRLRLDDVEKRLTTQETITRELIPRMEKTLDKIDERLNALATER
jgi:phage gp37-like protein